MSIENFTQWKNWVDYKRNPLLVPEAPEWLVADPTFIPPDDSPDGKFHLFAHGFLFGINHYISRDGLKWINTRWRVGKGMRGFLYMESDKYYLIYENNLGFSKSIISLRESSDLFHWSEPQTLLVPDQPWEINWKGQRKISNPCLVKYNGKYRLYYSANQIFLWDCLFSEPLYIAVAEAEKLQGPYKKFPRPIISPSKAHKFRNFAAGAIKIVRINDTWIGFNNGIYNHQHHTGSCILLLQSDDGITWNDIFERPILYPTTGWKSAFVYQCDIRKVGDQFWLYYNARNGWAIGSEGIGLAKLKNTIS